MFVKKVYQSTLRKAIIFCLTPRYYALETNYTCRTLPQPQQKPVESSV